MAARLSALNLCARQALLAAPLAALVACTASEPPPAPEPPQSARPEARPDLSAPAPDPTPDLAAMRQARATTATTRNAAPQSETSRQMARLFAGAQASFLARGLMRQDREPKDAPFTADDLARNFVQIALHDEYTRQNGRLVAQTRAAPLRRWQDPITMQVVFGNSVPDAQRNRDGADIAGFAARLSSVSGHPIRMGQSGANFVTLILSEDERRAIGPRLRQLVPDIPPADIAAIQDLSAQNYCTVFAYSRDGSAAYAKAVAVIRAELPDRLRLSCIHEELAQGMGLANDSPAARPSIFNDDEEFALLTRHDELLLKMLYDPRLRPGMTEAQATPIIRQIAGELIPRAAN
ncbi:MAG: DUF2927 domain-containing protein [Paracoccus sp. (in: a-proteobacteria)]|uniref:DUF2927 domain-containing protein n=1 Tax=Paracoccus sp. TaxID=267 RepID=UPI0026E03D65|nr:DUF2927 domain-containing protein [Paracoccus sp. (in: a-proteobacteria)]MDO5621088.1 DUF2927 domain-containing protein [Paracoccus sp. (in: a-proteobacteria)]